MPLGLGFPSSPRFYMVYGPLDRKVLPSLGVHRRPGGRGRVRQPLSRRGTTTETVAALPLACTFCVFEWNMERLGLGNIYVCACLHLHAPLRRAGGAGRRCWYLVTPRARCCLCSVCCYRAGPRGRSACATTEGPS
jgi:hypothetical protein